MDIASASYELAPVKKVDERHKINAGSDGILEAHEQGYKTLSSKLDLAANSGSPGMKRASAKGIELLDGKRGFSPLERQIAQKYFDHHARVLKLTRSLNITNGSKTYPTPSISICKSMAFTTTMDWMYFNTGNLANVAANSGKRHTFSKRYIGAVMEGLKRSTQAILNHTKPPVDRYGALSAATRRVLLNALAVFFKDETAIRQLPKTARADFLLSEKQLLDAHLYGPIGYYALGKDLRGSKSNYVSPANALSPLYGKMYASYVFRFYQKMRALGLIKDGELFTIFEHGGGDGRLARDMLTHIKAQAASGDREWKTFATSLRYTSVDISPEAVKRQNAISKDHPEFRAVLGNALTWKPKKPTKGIIISTLLIDSFMPHLLYKKKGKAHVVFNVPALAFETRAMRQASLKELFPSFLERKFIEVHSDVIERSYLEITHDRLNYLYFSKKSFDMLQNRLADMRKENIERFKAYADAIRMRMGFMRLYADASNAPRAAALLAKNPDYVASLHSEKPAYYINTDLEQYIRNAAHYFSAGALMAVDVGAHILEMMPLPIRAHLGVIPSISLHQNHRQFGVRRLPAMAFGNSLIYKGPDPLLIRRMMNEVSMGLSRIVPHNRMQRSYGTITASDLMSLTASFKRVFGGRLSPELKIIKNLYAKFIDSDSYRIYMSPIGTKGTLMKFWLDRAIDREVKKCSDLRLNIDLITGCAEGIINTFIYSMALAIPMDA